MTDACRVDDKNVINQEKNAASCKEAASLSECGKNHRILILLFKRRDGFDKLRQNLLRVVGGSADALYAAAERRLVEFLCLRRVFDDVPYNFRLCGNGGQFRIVRAERLHFFEQVYRLGKRGRSFGCRFFVLFKIAAVERFVRLRIRRFQQLRKRIVPALQADDVQSGRRFLARRLRRACLFLLQGRAATLPAACADAVLIKRVSFRRLVPSTDGADAVLRAGTAFQTMSRRSLTAAAARADLVDGARSFCPGMSERGTLLFHADATHGGRDARCAAERMRLRLTGRQTAIDAARRSRAARFSEKVVGKFALFGAADGTCAAPPTRRMRPVVRAEFSFGIAAIIACRRFLTSGNAQYMTERFTVAVFKLLGREHLFRIGVGNGRLRRR